MTVNCNLAVRCLLTFLVISDNENCLRYATARKCKHLLLQKKRRQRWRRFRYAQHLPLFGNTPSVVFADGFGTFAYFNLVEFCF